MLDFQSIKNRFDIIGNSEELNYALKVAMQVAGTDLSVLIAGESGVGKEAFSHIIHALSQRKHNPFIPVNCGAIPAGTIDSELFGHEKGAFTSAVDTRKGYFETVNGGTIFLDEIGEMPLDTQARLLRILETGEYIRVGSSKVQKTDVRVIAATNKDLLALTQSGKFREDLYYRLSTVPIRVPALRDRKEDICLLFRKFAVDFAEKYKAVPVQLDEDAKNLLVNYFWPGNIRELKNIAERLSVLSQDKHISVQQLRRLLPDINNPNRLPMIVGNGTSTHEFSNEREILYKVVFDMKKDMTDMKKMFVEILRNPAYADLAAAYAKDTLLHEHSLMNDYNTPHSSSVFSPPGQPVLIKENHIQEHEEVEENLNIMEKEKELILKALKKNKGKRKNAARDLGLSERTLYRKLKEYDIDV